MSQAQVPASSGSSGAGSIGSTKFLTVETAATWNGWARTSYIVPVHGSLAAAPSIGTATFRFNFGQIKREDSSGFAQENALDLLGQYIRVLRVGAEGSGVLWTGSIDVESFKPHGGAAGAGIQEFNAFEVGHELDRDAILGCKAENSFGGVTDIDWVPPANERYERGVREFGNRSASAHSDGAYYFSSDGAAWTNLDLAEMILKRYTPAGGPTFVLGGQKDALAQLKGVVQIAGRTPWNVLNQLISRRRGLGFYPEVQGQKVVLKVFSILEQKLKLGDVEIPGNTNIFNLDLDTSIMLEKPMATRSISTRFEELEARGERIVTVFTCGYDDDVLEKAWADNDQTDYDAGTGSDPDENDDFRKADRFEAVYVKHRIAPGWDGKVGVSGKYEVFPVFDDKGDYELKGGAYFFPLGKSFEDWLPFYETVASRSNPLDTAGLPSGAEPTFRRPFALAYDAASEKTFYVEKPLESLEISGAHFNLYPRELAFGVEAHPRHLYGKGYFDAGSPGESNTDPVVTYSRINATLALKTDQVLRMVARRDGVQSGERVRRKVIQVPEAHFWYCLPNTILDIDEDGAPVTYNGDGILRDDRDRLREHLAFALAWYGQIRRAIDVPIRDSLDLPTPIGAYIKAAVSGGTTLDIGTPVSCVEFDFMAYKATVKTMWAEADWEKD